MFIPFVILVPFRVLADEQGLCLDGFCIGQSIGAPRFADVQWIVPTKDYHQIKCASVGCRPAIAFRGYPMKYQNELTEALSWQYEQFGMGYNIITNQNLSVLRLYHYECNRSARGMWGERRFLGAYRSAPSGYLTVIGLRLIAGELRVYRIARQYPYHNTSELRSLARKVEGTYGPKVLIYPYLSSNAYSDVITQRKDGWFGRSTTFSPADLSDNDAELVWIDPATRTLLQPSSMPESGEIKPLPMHLPQECTRSMPLQ